MSESGANDVVLVRRERFENVQQIDRTIKHAKGAVHQLCAAGVLAFANGSSGTLEFVSRSLQQQFRSLMHDLKHQLVRMGTLLRTLLQGQQLICPQIPFVIGCPGTRQNRQRHLTILWNERLMRSEAFSPRLLGLVRQSTISPSRMWMTRSPTLAASGLCVIISTVCPSS